MKKKVFSLMMFFISFETASWAQQLAFPGAKGYSYTYYRNNVIYNRGYQSCYGDEAIQSGHDKFNFLTFNIVANYYKSGPATSPGEVSYRIANPGSRNETDDFGKWYIADNIVDRNKVAKNGYTMLENYMNSIH